MAEGLGGTIILLPWSMYKSQNGIAGSDYRKIKRHRDGKEILTHYNLNLLFGQ